MRLLLTLPLMLVVTLASAAQPVYRCETAGKVSYSDSPCVGAQVIDATPNEGVDKMSGKSRKSSALQRTELNRAMDDALKPLTGKSRDEMDVLRHRVRLSSQEQMECARLDRQLPSLESDTQTRDTKTKAEADVRLYQTRKRYFDLKC
jgi:hypothetical protein